MGSIQMEPPIEVWGACTPGQQQCMQLQCNQAPVHAQCSKTAAGWFYYGSCPGAHGNANALALTLPDLCAFMPAQRSGR